ncbi:hypothetical protein bcgnr5390_13800 [Bacillus luti]|nr:hypothetical protein BC2903_54780 [Bacillus cereus]
MNTIKENSTIALLHLTLLLTGPIGIALVCLLYNYILTGNPFNFPILLLGFLALGWLLPSCIKFRKSKNDGIQHTLKQIVNVQLSMYIYFIAIVLLFIVSDFVPDVLSVERTEITGLYQLLYTFYGICIVLIYYATAIIIAIIVSLNGKQFRYPLTIPFLR